MLLEMFANYEELVSAQSGVEVVEFWSPSGYGTERDDSGLQASDG